VEHCGTGKVAINHMESRRYAGGVEHIKVNARARGGGHLLVRDFETTLRQWPSTQRLVGKGKSGIGRATLRP
jgi:hypothetical protein